MKILETEVPNNIMEVYTLWLKHMELKECEQTLILFLQDVFIANGWKTELPNSIQLLKRIFTKNRKDLAFITRLKTGKYLEDIKLENIKQQLKEYENSRTDL